MGEPIEIDRTLSRDEIIDQYHTHWEIKRNKAEIGYAWVQTRIQTLGYKSLAEFSRLNKFGVTAGTVTNYLRGHSTMPLWFVPRVCYALKVTPNTFLTVMGYYEPDRQTLQD
jgi:hypothetical protein